MSTAFTRSYCPKVAWSSRPMRVAFVSPNPLADIKFVSGPAGSVSLINPSSAFPFKSSSPWSEAKGPKIPVTPHWCIDHPHPFSAHPPLKCPLYLLRSRYFIADSKERLRPQKQLSSRPPERRRLPH